jgi:hypothetical protein
MQQQAPVMPVPGMTWIAGLFYQSYRLQFFAIPGMRQPVTDTLKSTHENGLMG